MSSQQQPIIVKKIRKAGHGHHGGSWKVAFADFMTAMMAFFLVMWIIGLDEETRSAIAGYFNDPLDFAKKSQGSKLESLMSKDANQKGNEEPANDLDGLRWKEDEQKRLDELGKQIRQAIEQEGDLKELGKFVQISESEEGLVLEFVEGAGSMFFESGSAEVRPVARKLFNRLGGILAKQPRNMTIDGHTDAQPFNSSTGYDNWNLSNDRAVAVLRVLQSAGVQEKYILAVRGFADRRLKDKRNPLSFVNRRVTVLLPYKWKESEVLGYTGEKASSKQAVIRESLDIRRGETGPQ
ncbi:MAG: OmpA family protein [Armatimonadetes bacterium]|nr:MAG: chemotaxis protein MotB [Armatimonadota bacterium]MCE7899347.1 chemotaxis protein MotB [Armatimonadetes bacterium ATM1]MDL1927921.1 chemotaxis protein MotB [Fimbriimonadia bacterium ATM]MBC6969314.1 chemotaxis protein MotB [Armatimonadota bacterium]MBL1149503.1 chemotaxis protein MotB [Armatimonadota bacterium]